MKYLIVFLVMFGLGYTAKLHVENVADKRQKLVLELKEDRTDMMREVEMLESMIAHKSPQDQIDMENQILRSKYFIFFMSKENLDDFDNTGEGKLLLVYRRYF